MESNSNTIENNNIEPLLNHDQTDKDNWQDANTIPSVNSNGNSDMRDEEKANSAWQNYNILIESSEQVGNNNETNNTASLSPPMNYNHHSNNDYYNNMQNDAYNSYYNQNGTESWQHFQYVNQQRTPMYHANQQLFVPPKNKAIPIVNPNTSQIVDIVHKPKVASIANPTTVIIDQTPRPIKIVNPNEKKELDLIQSDEAQHTKEDGAKYSDDSQLVDQSSKISDIEDNVENMKIKEVNEFEGTPLNNHTITEDMTIEETQLDNAESTPAFDRTSRSGESSTHCDDDAISATFSLSSESFSDLSDNVYYFDSDSSSVISDDREKKPARMITDFTTIKYPRLITPPENPPEGGRIKYDASFLLRFRNVCTKTDKDLSLITTNLKKKKEIPWYERTTPSNSQRDFSSRERSSRNYNKPQRKYSRHPQHVGREESASDSWIKAPEAAVTLRKSENRWVPAVVSTEGSASTASEAAAKQTPDVDLVPQDMIARKVKALLNKLTLEKFDSISSQIWAFAKQSVHETDAISLKNVIGLVFDKAVDEPNFASMWAKLCKRMYQLMEEDETAITIQDGELKGLALFRRYLLNRCQEGFEKGWKSEMEEKVIEEMSDEYYEAVKIKRRGLGLVQFIGELFKLQMLTDRIMVYCLLRLCPDPHHPKDDETETICKLLTTIGETFDGNEKNKEWLDKYFVHMDVMYKSTTLSSRIKFKILDVFDLRKNKWVSRK